LRKLEPGWDRSDSSGGGAGFQPPLARTEAPGLEPNKSVCTVRTSYYRLHGKGGAHYRYSDADLTELMTRVGRGPACVLFNNTAMWDDARRFRRLLA